MDKKWVEHNYSHGNYPKYHMPLKINQLLKNDVPPAPLFNLIYVNSFTIRCTTFLHLWSKMQV